MNGQDDALEKVYAAGNAEELAAAYAVWASDYDRQTAALGYCLPFLVTAWVARHVSPAAGPLLDAGCGTGLSGPYLRALGYNAVVGLDFSDRMLALAAQRQSYAGLVQAELGKPLPFADGHFAAVFSTGVFTEGHAPATSLLELVRITRPGGHAIFTVRDTVYARDGFDAVIGGLEREGRWRRVEASPPFRAFAVAEPEVLVSAFVFAVL